MNVLITGGAGFIGSYVADELLREGHAVRVLDNLHPQVHGDTGQRPAYLHPDVELIEGDVRDRGVLRRALRGIDAVYHFAAAVGVGQSMYEVARYTEVNNMGTAILLEQLMETPVQRLVVASSMSIYGEGIYERRDGRKVQDAARSVDQLKRGEWEVRDETGETLSPLPTPETKRPTLASVYALSKFDQERLCLMLGEAYGIPAVALRFFNTYGPRQALSNPYTGVLAIFAARLMNGKPPLVFEDGRQRRDFVSVHDVARACFLALDNDAATGQVFNVGSGEPRSVLEVAEELARILGREDIEPEVTGKYRAGDIRNCFADISKARRVLGYEPRVRFEDGLKELVEWLGSQTAVDKVDRAFEELEERRLVL